MNESEEAALPEINIQRELSTKLDLLLQEYEMPNENNQLHHEMDKTFIAIKERLKKLKTIHSPKNSIKNPSRNIDNYIKQKFNSFDTADKNSTPATQRLEQVSFEMYRNVDNTELITKQKRKFGQFWQEASQSFDSTYVPKLPEIKKKTGDKKLTNRGSITKAQKEVRNHKLECLIKEYMGKRLGLMYSNHPIKKKNTVKMNKRNSIKVNNSVNKEKVQQPKLQKYFEDEDIDEEYKRYFNSPSLRIKLEKILITQHAKKRKHYPALSD